MAGKALSLLPPLLLAAAGLAGLLLLCVPTRDIREPPALVHARAPGQPGVVRGGSDRAGARLRPARASRDSGRSLSRPGGGSGPPAALRPRPRASQRRPGDAVPAAEVPRSLLAAPPRGRLGAANGESSAPQAPRTWLARAPSTTGLRVSP